MNIEQIVKELERERQLWIIADYLQNEGKFMSSLKKKLKHYLPDFTFSKSKSSLLRRIEERKYDESEPDLSEEIPTLNLEEALTKFEKLRKSRYKKELKLDFAESLKYFPTMPFEEIFPVIKKQLIHKSNKQVKVAVAGALGRLAELALNDELPEYNQYSNASSYDQRSEAEKDLIYSNVESSLKIILDEYDYLISLDREEVNSAIAETLPKLANISVRIADKYYVRLIENNNSKVKKTIASNLDKLLKVSWILGDIIYGVLISKESYDIIRKTAMSSYLDALKTTDYIIPRDDMPSVNFFREYLKRNSVEGRTDKEGMQSRKSLKDYISENREKSFSNSVSYHNKVGKIKEDIRPLLRDPSTDYTVYLDILESDENIKTLEDILQRKNEIEERKKEIDKLEKERIECASFTSDGLEFLEKLGSGLAGTTYRVRSEPLKDIDLAVKVFEEGKYSRKELEILFKLMHPNIVRVHYTPSKFVKKHNQPVDAILMEYIEGKTLEEILNENPNGLNPDKVKSYSQQLLSAIIYLREQDPPITHRDIRPSNIKITPKGKLVVMDLGNATEENPPVQKGNRRYGGEDDFFSWGLLTYKMWSGEHLVLTPSEEREPTKYGVFIEEAKRRLRNNDGSLKTEFRDKLFASSYKGELMIPVFCALQIPYKKKQDKIPDEEQGILNYFKQTRDNLV